MEQGKESELIVLDETGSESDGDTSQTIQVSDQEDLDVLQTENDLIVLDEYTSDAKTSFKRQISEEPLPKKRLKTDQESDYELQIKTLQKDNEILRSTLSDLQKHPSIAVGGKNKDLIHIGFNNESVFKRFKDEIEKFISNLLQSYEEDCVDNLFLVDNSSCENVANEKSNWKIPLYSATYQEALVHKDHTAVTNNGHKEKKHSAKPTCFNCLGDHFLNDCPVAHDRYQINQNRTKFFSKFGGKQSRYHVEDDLKFTKYKAGCVSKELRKALKLEKHQLPPYIYKMRMIGYPPGWLLEAQVLSSGLTMYDSEGKEVLDDNLEDGEVAEPGEMKIQYDPSRLIEYPGFNVYPESAIIDEYEKHGALPMQPHQLKSYFELHMKPPDANPFVRKQNRAIYSKPATSAKNEDMEIEDIEEDGEQNTDPTDSGDCIFIPPLPREPFEKPPPPPEADDSTSSTSKPEPRTKTRTPSPTLEDLEQEKEKLMLQLLQQNDQSLKPNAQFARRHTISSPETSLSDSEASGSELHHQLKRTFSASKDVTFGTPIVTPLSPYHQLPEQHKFSNGITEHLPFENLPNSIGHYERFKGLLSKIRNKFSKNT